MTAAYVLLESGRISSFLEEQRALIGDAFGVTETGYVRRVPGPSAESLIVLVDAMKQAGVWSVDASVCGGFASAVEERDRKRRYSVSLFWIGRWRITQSITRSYRAVSFRGSVPGRGWRQVVGGPRYLR